MDRDRHCTAAQMREALTQLRDDDVLCFVNPTSGHIDVLRDGTQVGQIGVSAQDLGKPQPPEAGVVGMAGEEFPR